MTTLHIYLQCSVAICAQSNGACMVIVLRQPPLDMCRSSFCLLLVCSGIYAVAWRHAEVVHPAVMLEQKAQGEFVTSVNASTIPRIARRGASAALRTHGRVVAPQVQRHIASRTPSAFAVPTVPAMPMPSVNHPISSAALTSLARTAVPFVEREVASASFLSYIPAGLLAAAVVANTFADSGKSADYSKKAHDNQDAKIAKKWPSSWRDDLQEIRYVGKGAFGKVYVARSQERHGDMVAVKRVSVEPNMLPGAHLEALYLSMAKGNPHVVQLRDAVWRKPQDGLTWREMDQETWFNFGESSKDETEMLIKMEAAAGGDLQAVVKNKNLDMKLKARLIVQFLRGLKSLHMAGLVHNDLKPENILLSHAISRDEGGEEPQIKITDLGGACIHDRQLLSTIPGRLQRKAFCHTAAGYTMHTEAYLAPEIRGDRGFDIRGIDPKSDMWAVGLILYQLAVHQNGDLPRNIRPKTIGKQPPKKLTRADFPENWLDQDPTFRFQFQGVRDKPAPLEGNEDLSSLIKDLLHPDPHQRPDATEALERADAWLKSIENKHE